MQAYKEKMIHLLVESGAIQFGDFVAKSGRKTPYFINTGRLMYGNQLDTVGEMYAETYNEHMGNEVRLLYGPAYKGITLIAVTAAALFRKFQVKVPICFNRKEKKDHGEGGVFVGKIPEKNDKLVIIEDVITAGTSIRETMELLKNLEDVRVEAIIIAVDRMEKGTGEESTLVELEREYGVKIYPIVSIKEVVSYLHNREIDGKVYIDDVLYQKIEAYQNKYGIEK